jgi:D-alanyl-D-alanine carboxypeptidase
VKPSAVIPVESSHPLQFTAAPKTSDPSGAAPEAPELAKADRGAAAATPPSTMQAGLSPAESALAMPAPALAAKPPRNGWMIQVGAYPDEKEAKQKLAAVKRKAAHLLATAAPMTEPVQRDGAIRYRARFAGFDKEKAEAACKYLKRNDIECLAIKN